MLCVIGGKLSEGINFSDNLAREIIIAGLPFSNTFSVEIEQKMKFWDKKAKELNS